MDECMCGRHGTLTQAYTVRVGAALLTLSYDQGRVEQEVAHQLSSQLAEEPTGHCPVENRILILHHVHQTHRRRALLLGHAQDLSMNTQTHFYILFQSTNNYVAQRCNIGMFILFFIYSKHTSSQPWAHA